MSAEEYAEKFSRVQAYLHSGDCYQVNLAQRFRGRRTRETNGRRLPASMPAIRPRSVHFYALNTAPSSAFRQSVLFTPADGMIQTRPIKGTLPRLANADADRQQAETLAASPKDRAENLMIVDLMRNDIGRVAEPGSVRVPELFVVEPFPAVHHLVSTITARLPASRTACDLLRAAFPGGSITGAPKVRAMEIIDELEPHRRNASVRQHRLCESVRHHGYQHHYSHPDGVRR